MLDTNTYYEFEVSNTGEFVTRKPIFRKGEYSHYLGAHAGYWVVRYKGHYHPLRGGSHIPYYISLMKYGKC